MGAEAGRHWSAARASGQRDIAHRECRLSSRGRKHQKPAGILSLRSGCAGRATHDSEPSARVADGAHCNYNSVATHGWTTSLDMGSREELHESAEARAQFPDCGACFR